MKNISMLLSLPQVMLTFDEFKQERLLSLSVSLRIISLLPGCAGLPKAATAILRIAVIPKGERSKAKELGTFSGKIEFVSESLKKFTPDDTERPVVARYIPSWEGYDSELASKYPFS